MVTSQATRMPLATIYDALPDDLREDYDAELRRAMLAVAGVHGVYATLYRERQHDAQAHEDDVTAAREINAEGRA